MHKTLESRVKAQNASLKEKYDELDRLYEALVRKEKARVLHFNYNLKIIIWYNLYLRYALYQVISSINLSFTII